MTARGGIAEDGFIFLTPSNGKGHDGPMIVDDAGELVWMRPDLSGYATDLRVASYQGQPVLVWWEGDNNAGIGSGEHVVVDAAYRELFRVPGGHGRQADLHEFRLTDRNTALFFADAVVGAGAGPGQPADLLDCAVQEVDLVSGAVVFEWHSLDHIDVSESVEAPPAEAGQAYDYFHANSIDEDADGNLIVSARNTSAVYKIERPTGRVLWRLGGKRSDFRMGPGTGFALQHDARRRPDGTLSIFDDGQAGPSRGIVLRIDETAMTAALVREYPSPAGLLSTSQGNVQFLPGGNVFVGWGSVPRFSEFSVDGRLVLDAGFTASQSYRDFRFPWVGRPMEPPAIAVDVATDGLVVFASWNGATEVASWEVLAGGATGAMRSVATSPRRGFETVISVPGLALPGTRFAARALDAAGAVLGISPTIAAPV